MIDADRHFCAHCGQHAVQILRDERSCLARCDRCGRHWGYPNGRLTDETVLHSYQSHAEPREAD